MKKSLSGSSCPSKINGNENNVVSLIHVPAPMTLSCMHKIRDGEGICVVSSIVHGNKVNDKNGVVSLVVDRNVVGVPAPKIISSLTRIHVDEYDACNRIIFIIIVLTHRTQHLRRRNTNYIPIYNNITLVTLARYPLDKNNKFHFVSIKNW
ncbi:hypothetical protein H5410_046174 [Solanum commersonii]|uniref:Uncharacterized protein n=1 Tax=Solanum commersonii TaxID=4109 RepID=A0A9J5XET8_SOLCO|nr:hypothetical protein H5410_046174 [Solanum commersonii]